MNLKINDRIKVRDVEFFNGFSMNLRYDSLTSTFGFGFYFDPFNEDHRELCCVSHYHEATIEHNDKKLITGYILSQSFESSTTKKLVGISGYSLTGVLEDCEIPPSLYPLQSDGLSLKEIAEKLLKPFNLTLVIDPLVAERANKVYKNTTAKETQKIKDYLCELAKQRNIIVSHNSEGNILFTEAKTEIEPILQIGEEGLPGVAMSLAFSGQQMHSEITVMKQADSEGGNSGEYTIKNPYVPIVYRPCVIVQSSGDDNDTEQAAKMALSAELKNIVLTINVDRWEVDGVLLLPNNTVRIKNYDLFLFKDTDWFIESISYTGNNVSQTAVLTCVLPEVYNSNTPENVFVDPHANFPRLS